MIDWRGVRARFVNQFAYFVLALAVVGWAAVLFVLVRLIWRTIS